MFQIKLVQRGEETVLKLMEVPYPVNLDMLIPNDSAATDCPLYLAIFDKHGKKLASKDIPLGQTFSCWDALIGYYGHQEMLTQNNTPVSEAYYNSTEEKNEKTLTYLTENKWRLRLFLFAVGMITLSLLVRGVGDISKGQGLAVFSGASLLIMMILLLVFIGSIVKKIHLYKKD
jgi:hypothetical protein